MICSIGALLVPVVARAMTRLRLTLKVDVDGAGLGGNDAVMS